MEDSFKESLNQITGIMWATLAVSASLLLLDPNAKETALLGLALSSDRLVFVAPIALIGLLSYKQVLIRNMSEIVRKINDTSELKLIVGSYPLIEFMRWRLGAGSVESSILTVFQSCIDIAPAFSIIFLLPLIPAQTSPVMLYLLVAILALLSLWNYSTLQRRVFEPLAGTIKSPD